MTANTETGTALVTGASSGIGLAITQRLLASGWRVAGVSRRPPSLEDAAFTHLPLDLADTVAREALPKHFADLQAIVHAAGLLRPAALGEPDPAGAAEMWRLHVEATGWLVDRLADSLSDGGRIVLIGSRLGAGSPRRAHYAATKAAMVGLARSWAAELLPRKITVNVVAPGATRTPMLIDPSRGGEAPRTPPMGRFIEPSEVAAAVAFLLSPQAAMITGQQLVICGGASL